MPDQFFRQRELSVATAFTSYPPAADLYCHHRNSERRQNPRTAQNKF